MKVNIYHWVTNSLSVDYNLMNYQSGERKTICCVDNELMLKFGVYLIWNLPSSANMLFLRLWNIWGWLRQPSNILTSNYSPCYVRFIYITPHLEYCVQVWSPFMAFDIDVLEEVQHRATKLIPSIADLLYEQRLKVLNHQVVDLQWLYLVVGHSC